MWSSIQKFVMDWQEATFIIVFFIITMCLLYAFLTFVKKSYGGKSKAKVKWSAVIAIVVLAALLAILAAARWA